MRPHWAYYKSFAGKGTDTAVSDQQDPSYMVNWETIVTLVMSLNSALNCQLCLGWGEGKKCNS